MVVVVVYFVEDGGGIGLGEAGARRGGGLLGEGTPLSPGFAQILQSIGLRSGPRFVKA